MATAHEAHPVKAGAAPLLHWPPQSSPPPGRALPVHHSRELNTLRIRYKYNEWTNLRQKSAHTHTEVSMARTYKYVCKTRCQWHDVYSTSSAYIIVCINICLCVCVRVCVRHLYHTHICIYICIYIYLSYIEVLCIIQVYNKFNKCM